MLAPLEGRAESGLHEGANYPPCKDLTPPRRTLSFPKLCALFLGLLINYSLQQHSRRPAPTLKVLSTSVPPHPSSRPHAFTRSSSHASSPPLPSPTFPPSPHPSSNHPRSTQPASLSPQASLRLNHLPAEPPFDPLHTFLPRCDPDAGLRERVVMRATEVNLTSQNAFK